MTIVPVILSGGSGTRLWPLSRNSFPKPFVTLPDGETLIQKTLRRSLPLREQAPLLIVTNRDYYFLTRDTLSNCARAHGQPIGNVQYLLEPAKRNTAPAIAASALWAAATVDPEAILLVLPSDHLIQDQQLFAQSVQDASALAAAGYLVTFGIAPTLPETGFGYIQQGAQLDSGYQVARFVEKPTLETVQSYLASGEYLWNSGMFCFRASTLIQALQTLSPEILATVQSALDTGQANGDTLELGEEFALSPDISIDYAVMEKAPNVAVVRAGFDWSDLGAWSSYGLLMEKDAQGNQIHAQETVLVDTHNCVIQSPHRITATLGLEDLLIVDTPDALLVADRNRDQEVKKIVEILKIRDHACFDLHTTVHRPWGTYTTLEEGDHFKIKRIVVKPGHKLSLQMHYHRSEHWVVVSGTAKSVNGEEEKLIMTNQSTYIPAGCKHRLENPGRVNLIMIEVQSGSYLGEDDIVRFDDVYGRAPEIEASPA